MTPQELYDALWEQKRLQQAYAGYAELTRPVVLAHWDGTWTPDGQPRHLPTQCQAGQTVRIVMVSRFGDMGITDRLANRYGYALRTRPEDGLLTNCRLQHEPLPTREEEK